MKFLVILMLLAGVVGWGTCTYIEEREALKADQEYWDRLERERGPLGGLLDQFEKEVEEESFLGPEV